MNDDLVPENLLDIDDKLIGGIKEHSEMVYPDDGSILRIDNFEIAGKTHTKSLVYKDNLVFGIRERLPEPPTPEEKKEYGLVTRKIQGDCEFWLNFENDTKLLVEYTKLERNQQKEKPIPEPPKPTPEEIAAEEARLKAEAAK